MAEYIEREKTVELLRSLGNREYRKEKGTIQDAIKMISYPEYTPAVDAVPVIRCKDCRFGHVYKTGEMYCVHPDGIMRITPTDYCSYAERKDGKQ